MNSTNTVGFTSVTPDHLIIDSGAIYKDYSLPTEALIAATSGGNEVNIKVTMRGVKVDGLKMDDIKGLKIFQSATITMKSNLLECTADILKMALVADVDTSNVDYDNITGRTSILLSDYIDNIALVGRLSGSFKPIVVIIKNVLNTGGLSLKADDDKDNILPIELTAHLDPNNPTVLPYEIHYPKPLSGAPFYLVNTPIINAAKVVIDFSDIVMVTPPLAGFNVTVNGVADVVTGCERGINDLSTIQLTLTTPPTSGQLVTVAYTKPVLDADDVKSLSTVALASFAPVAVTNN